MVERCGNVIDYRARIGDYYFPLATALKNKGYGGTVVYCIDKNSIDSQEDGPREKSTRCLSTKIYREKMLQKIPTYN